MVCFVRSVRPMSRLMSSRSARSFWRMRKNWHELPKAAEGMRLSLKPLYC